MMKLKRWATRYYRDDQLINETFHFFKLAAQYVAWEFNHHKGLTKFGYVKVEKR